MSASAPEDIVPGVSRSGSARPSRIPRGPRTRSQANTATDLGEQESPTGIAADKNDLDEKFENMGSEIRRENKKPLEAELALLQKQLELQKSEFHTAWVELTARVDLVEKERGDVTDGLRPEVLASLKLSVKDARRDANQALESLGKFRTSIDDRFDRAAHRLKDLEQAAGCRALRGKTMSPPQAEHRAFGGAGSDWGDHPWGNRHEIRARSAVGN